MSLLSLSSPRRIESWLVISVISLCLLLSLLFGVVSYQLISHNITSQTGSKALSLAHLIASRQDVIHALNQGKGDNEFLATINALQQAAGADFIVIGDTKLTRLAHPQAGKIGKTMVGGDSQQALAGQAYISHATGTLGRSIRGKVPVYHPSGQIIGLVSVGFLHQSLGSRINQQWLVILFTLLLALILASAAALWLARRLKTLLHGLQPREIARLFSEQNAILNTVNVGVMVLEANGEIRKYNRKAATLLQLPHPAVTSQPLQLQQLLPKGAGLLLSDPQIPLDAFEMYEHNHALVISRQPFQINHEAPGLLLTFSPLNDVEKLSRQLANVQRFAELLRVQTHDYANKLNTLGAMLQLGAYDKAIDFIGRESQGWQEQIGQLLAQIKDVTIAGLLMGKYHKAREMNVALTFSPDSRLSQIAEPEVHEQMIAIFGNLIDNAIDAACQHSHNTPPQVLITLDETATDWIFDVEDTGPGLDDAAFARMCSPNYSSKTDPRHGVGMLIVRSNLDACNGSLEWADAELGGARLTVYLPKHRPIA